MKINQKIFTHFFGESKIKLLSLHPLFESIVLRKYATTPSVHNERLNVEKDIAVGR
jgi:hypothetical protein